MTTTNYLRVLVVLTTMAVAALVAASLLAARPAHAVSTFTVTRTGDQADTNLADNKCDTSGLPGSQCTLRAAIQEANDTANSGGSGLISPDLIRFGLSGNGPHTISPNSELPEITDAVNIDGYTQPGSSPNTLAQGTNAVLKIELDGSGIAGQPSGITIQTNNTRIRGLVINNFKFNGVGIFGDPAVVSSNTVEGNFIGTDPTGTLDLGNSRDGVFENSGGGNTIGGATPAARNLISGNNVRGIIILGGGLNEVQGNLIGTKADGISPLGNDNEGVKIFTSNNSVGGTASGETNTIAFNALEGVVVGGDSSAGNRILGNSIFSNGGLGIDLEGGTQDANGATANDPLDPDTGPNNLQNKPGLTSATNSATTTTVQGKLNSTPNTTFTVQLFSNRLGTDEGKKFVGDKTVTTDGSGKANFTKAINPAVRAGQTITATATDPSGNTSEFSAPRTVVAG